jgi:hypothetical protein
MVVQQAGLAGLSRVSVDFVRWRTPLNNSKSRLEELSIEKETRICFAGGVDLEGIPWQMIGR